MNHTLRQRSQLVIAAERGLRAEKYRSIWIKFALLVVVALAVGALV